MAKKSKKKKPSKTELVAKEAMKLICEKYQEYLEDPTARDEVRNHDGGRISLSQAYELAGCGPLSDKKRLKLKPLIWARLEKKRFFIFYLVVGQDEVSFKISRNDR